uniref:Multidrug and toxin extrusion protein n=1 Tax=Schistocephalus solidus TaxID=70667 RepID=A0A0X3PUH5_SCHSO
MNMLVRFLLNCRGSALSQSLGFMTEAVSLLAYIIFSKMYRKTWNGIRIELWHDWGIWMHLGVAGLVMSGMEWWVCEAGSLVSGILGEKDLAVQTILNNVESIVFVMFPLGFAIATTIRVGQYLGANDNGTPRSAACVGFTVVLASGVVSVVILTALRKQIPKIFSHDPGVIEMASQYFPSVITFQFFDAINGINGGIVRGVGKQKIGAVVCCVCMYLIGGPAGLCLMFLTPLGVSGFWWGLSIGSFAQSVTYTIICARIDWTKECERAAKRTTIKFIGDTDELEVKSIDSPRAYDRREGSFSPDKVDYEDKEDENSQEEEEEPVKRCPSRVLLTRSVFISIMVLMLAVSICCRLVLDWSDYFPSYCLLSNFSLLPIPKRSERLMNPEAFKWLKRDCLDILPSQ